MKQFFQEGKAQINNMGIGNLICFILLGLLSLSFFILPFFNYGEGVARTIMTIIYGICSIADFVIFYISPKFYKQTYSVKDTEFEKSNKKLYKISTILGKIFSVLMVQFIFVMIFLNTNYHTEIHFYDIIIYILITFLFMCAILFCIAQFVDKTKKYANEMLNMIILGISLIFLFYYLKTDETLFLLIGLPILIIDLYLHEILEAMLPDDLKKNIFGKMNMCIFFIVLIIAGGIFIYSLRLGQDIINNIFVVYGATIGGSLTLLGVLFSIKHQEKVRQEERRLQFKPHFRLISQSYHSSFEKSTEQAVYLINFEESYNKTINMVLKEEPPQEGYKRIEFASFVLDNSDFSSFYFKELIVNNQSTKLGYFIKKSESAIFRTTYIDFPENEEVAIYLIVEDLEKRIYKYKVVFEKAKEKEKYIIKNMEEIIDGDY